MFFFAKFLNHIIFGMRNWIDEHMNTLIFIRDCDKDARVHMCLHLFQITKDDGKFSLVLVQNFLSAQLNCFHS